MSDRWSRLGVALTALAGLIVASYLTWVHYDRDLLICTSSGGCETVQSSEYAVLAGVPIALIGAIAYAVVLVLVAWDAPPARLAVACIALTGLAFAAYLVILQAFVIDAWCIWCLVNDVIVLPLLAVLSGLRLRHS